MTDTQDLRSGSEWNESGLFDFRVLDPDGWDRKTRSWYDEKISRVEFESRAMHSTCQWRSFP